MERPGTAVPGRYCFSAFGQRLEGLFARAAHRAAPVFRQILKADAGRNLAALVASRRVIDIAAIAGLAPVHVSGIGHGAHQQVHSTSKYACGWAQAGQRSGAFVPSTTQPQLRQRHWTGASRRKTMPSRMFFAKARKRFSW